MSLASEIRRLRGAWPVPGWDDERVAAFVHGVMDQDEHNVRAGVDEIIRAWSRDFPPSPADLRSFVVSAARVDQRSRLQHRPLADEEIAPPWFRLLIEATVHARLRERGAGGTMRPELAAMVEMVEDLGYRAEHGIAFDPNEDPKRHAAACHGAQVVWERHDQPEGPEIGAIIPAARRAA